VKIVNFHFMTDDHTGKLLTTVSLEVDSVGEARQIFDMFSGSVGVAVTLPVVQPVQAVEAPKPVETPKVVEAVKPAEVQVVKPVEAGPSYKSISDRDTLKKLCVDRGIVDASNRSGAAAFVAMLEAYDRTQASNVEEPAKVEEPKVVETTVPPVVPAEVAAPPAAPPAAAPAPASLADVPDVLVNATSFRQVMTWMLDRGLKTQEDIVRECEKWRGVVPAISRLSGDLNDRVGRALEVLRMERAPS